MTIENLENQDATILDAELTDEVDNLDTEPQEDNSENEPTQDDSDKQATAEDGQEKAEKFEIPEKYKQFVANPEEPTPQELAIIKQFQEQDKTISKFSQEKSELQKKQELEKQQYEERLLEAKTTKLEKDYQEAEKVFRDEKLDLIDKLNQAKAEGKVSELDYRSLLAAIDNDFEAKKKALDNLYSTQKNDAETKIKEHIAGKIQAEYQKFETDFSEKLKLDENKFLYDAYKTQFNDFGSPEELPMIMDWAEKYYQARKARETKATQLDNNKQQIKTGLKGAASNSSGKSQSKKNNHTVEDCLNNPEIFSKYF